MISEGHAGEHGRILMERDHFRRVFKTSERPTPEELDRLERIQYGLGDMPKFIDRAPASWYKFDNLEIPILTRNRNDERLVSLSQLSSVVKGLKSVEQMRVYVPRDRKVEAKQIIDSIK